MSRHRPPLQRTVLALLALWLGLWPAADAVTGATTIVIVEPATESAGARCPLPASVITQTESPGCCKLDRANDGPESGCCESSRTRCCRCFSLGGMVLFAAAAWSLDADRDVHGTVSVAGIFAPSRHLQPPVPPPWPLS